MDAAACDPDTGPAVVVDSFRVDGPEGAYVSRGLAESLAVPLVCSGAKMLPVAGVPGALPPVDDSGAVKLKAAAADTAAGDDDGALVFPNKDFVGAVPARP